MALTIKQENFCLAYIETNNASDAYRRSFNADKMKSVTINKRASEFLNRRDIAGRIQELRKPAIDAAQITLKEHLNALKKLRDDAAMVNQFSAAITAEIHRGKASGFYIDKSKLGNDKEDPLLSLIMRMQGTALLPVRITDIKDNEIMY
jgi:phage terminase small subunit